MKKFLFIAFTFVSTITSAQTWKTDTLITNKLTGEYSLEQRCKYTDGNVSGDVLISDRYADKVCFATNKPIGNIKINMFTQSVKTKGELKLYDENKKVIVSKSINISLGSISTNVGRTQASFDYPGIEKFLSTRKGYMSITCTLLSGGTITIFTPCYGNSLY